MLRAKRGRPTARSGRHLANRAVVGTRPQKLMKRSAIERHVDTENFDLASDDSESEGRLSDLCGDHNFPAAAATPAVGPVQARAHRKPHAKTTSCVSSDSEDDDKMPVTSDSESTEGRLSDLCGVESDDGVRRVLNMDSAEDDDEDADADAPDFAGEEDKATSEEDDASESDDDGNDDHQSSANRVSPKGTSSAGYVDPLPRCLRGVSVPSRQLVEAMSDKNWDVQHHEDQTNRSPWAVLTETKTNAKFCVVWPRVAKAKLHLTYDSCADTMKMAFCGCRKSCNTSFGGNTEHIRTLRRPIFEDCTTTGEVNAFLVSKLQATGGECVLAVPVEKGRNRLVPTCRKYYAAAHGVSETVIRKCLKVAKSGRHLPESCASGSAGYREAPKYECAYTFWSLFFEQHCQRPNNTTRIFPVDKTYGDIYAEYFLPWFEHQVETNNFPREEQPAFGTWKKARRDPDFSDVKDRVKHTHARCKTCSDLKTLLLDAFKSGTAMREYKQRRRMHDEEVTQWRKLEKVIKARVVGSQGEEILIVHDGTQKLGLPRMTRRTIKNLNPARFDVVPWMSHDVAGGRSDYIYAPNASTSKSTNYLISQFHAVVLRAKSDYKDARHRARKLTVIADSASENKNNTILAYYSDMVASGWFDEVELLFGPVGHTHNGVDATHKIHNVDVARHTSGDLGHFVHHYASGFSGQSSLPTPDASILARIVDWKGYYAPFLRNIAGFTKTKGDPIMVRGFKIAKTTNGSVDVRWKCDPANESEWRGQSGFGNTAGFNMLLAVPRGLPAFEPPSRVLKTAGHAEHGKTLLNSGDGGLRRALLAQGLEACVQWNYTAHMEGKIPIHRYLEDVTPPGEWGRLCEVGAVDGKRGRMREITDFWDGALPKDHATLWRLPVCPRNSHLDATANKFHYSMDAAVLASARIPLVRPRGIRADNCEAARHPNNMAGNGWVVEEQEEKQVVEEQEEKEVVEEQEAREVVEVVGVVEEQQEEHNNRRFEEMLSECTVGVMAVGMCEATSGPSPYIFVGQVVSVERDAKPYPMFTMVPFNCVADSWHPDCLHRRWNKARGQVRFPHYSVMQYFPRLNKNSNQIPRKVVGEVQKRNIKWHEEEE